VISSAFSLEKLYNFLIALIASGVFLTSSKKDSSSHFFLSDTETIFFYSPTIYFRNENLIILMDIII